MTDTEVQNKIAIYIPTSYRSHNLQRLIDSVRDTSDAIMYFILPKDDPQTWSVLSKNFQPHKKDLYWWSDDPNGDTRFVTRIQKIYEYTDEPWFLTGADDIVFHSDWLEEAKCWMESNSVISFDDMCNPNVAGTNFLIKRKYIKEQSAVIDSPNTVFHQGYFHNFCDNELVGTAKKRETFVKSAGKIEHLHHTIGKSDNDKIYQLAQSHWDEDAALYHSRAHLWS